MTDEELDGLIFDSIEFREFIDESFSVQPLVDRCELVYGGIEESIEAFKLSDAYDEYDFI